MFQYTVVSVWAQLWTGFVSHDLTSVDGPFVFNTMAADKGALALKKMQERDTTVRDRDAKAHLWLVWTLGVILPRFVQMVLFMLSFISFAGMHRFFFPMHEKSGV